MTWSWADIIARQIEGKVFHTWSSSGKALNLEFSVECIDTKRITFRKQNGKLQHLPRAAAESILENWDQHKEGRVSRKELSADNRATSYMLGLLKGLEALSAA